MQEKKVVATISLDDINDVQQENKDTETSPTKKKENNLVIETAVVVNDESDE